MHTRHLQIHQILRMLLLVFSISIHFVCDLGSIFLYLLSLVCRYNSRMKVKQLTKSYIIRFIVTSIKKSHRRQSWESLCSWQNRFWTSLKSMKYDQLIGMHLFEQARNRAEQTNTNLTVNRIKTTVAEAPAIIYIVITHKRG